LDLTPGMALAEAIINDIDRNRDGMLSFDEQRVYSTTVLGAIDVTADGKPLLLKAGTFSFPDSEAIRRGEGTIRIRSDATLPALSAGDHRVSFHNKHHPEGTVYLANALVPASDRVAITAQRRAKDQSELLIEYAVQARSTSTNVWLLGSIALPIVLWALLIRRRRSAGADSPPVPKYEHSATKL
jgi:hypothetical protein